ncbi:MAG TPA: hypothetical protein VGM29_04815 [Polyangiaceae bacterium]
MLTWLLLSGCLHHPSESALDAAEDDADPQLEIASCSLPVGGPSRLIVRRVYQRDPSFVSTGVVAVVGRVVAYKSQRQSALSASEKILFDAPITPGAYPIQVVENLRGQGALAGYSFLTPRTYKVDVPAAGAVCVTEILYFSKDLNESPTRRVKLRFQEDRAPESTVDPVAPTPPSPDTSSDPDSSRSQSPPQNQ